MHSAYSFFLQNFTPDTYTPHHSFIGVGDVELEMWVCEFVKKTVHSLCVVVVVSLFFRGKVFCYRVHSKEYIMFCTKVVAWKMVCKFQKLEYKQHIQKRRIHKF